MILDSPSVLFIEPIATTKLATKSMDIPDAKPHERTLPDAPSILYLNALLLLLIKGVVNGAIAFDLFSASPRSSNLDPPISTLRAGPLFILVSFTTCLMMLTQDLRLPWRWLQ